MSLTADIVLTTVGHEGRELIEDLSRRCGWPVTEQVPVTAKFNMQFAEGRLQLIDLAQGDLKPLFIDFLSEQLNYRRRRAAHQAQLIARAVGPVLSAEGEPRRVVDATAGLGVDAFLLATIGYRVTSVERSPVLFALLADAERRARADAEVAGVLEERLRFIHGEAAAYLQTLDDGDRPHVVYMDPMFPEAKKSALPKKGMQILRHLLGHEDEGESETLLRVSMSAARERVVVKRPPRAPALLTKPSHSYEGKAARYDVYRTQTR